MAIKNKGSAGKDTRMCCCPVQEHIDQSDLQRLVRDESIRLHNLPNTYANDIEGEAPYTIREFMASSPVPFRYRGCPRGSMTCCGSCSRVCSSRCAQDVMNRAYMFCGNLLHAKDEEVLKQRMAESSYMVRSLYEELVSEEPKYFVIASMVSNMSSPRFNKELERIILEDYNGTDTPYRFDYAPVVEMEEVRVKRPDGYTGTRYRKKCDPVTGEASVLYWPRSGMCPFCLPSGIVDRRRTTGDKDRRKSRKG